MLYQFQKSPKNSSWIDTANQGKFFEKAEFSSDSSASSVIYISSDEETSDDWDSDWSTDTEEVIRRVETEKVSSPILRAGRIMTTGSERWDGRRTKLQ